jgi:hypothetical protein
MNKFMINIFIAHHITRRKNMTFGQGVVTTLNSQTGNWSRTYTRKMQSFGIYNCTAITTIILDVGELTELTIVTSDAWDDDIYNGFNTIDITTTGTYNLVVRG